MAPLAKECVFIFGLTLIPKSPSGPQIHKHEGFPILVCVNEHPPNAKELRNSCKHQYHSTGLQVLF